LFSASLPSANHPKFRDTEPTSQNPHAWDGKHAIRRIPTYGTSLGRVIESLRGLSEPDRKRRVPHVRPGVHGPKKTQGEALQSFCVIDQQIQTRK
jgi:hypothetical protein